MLKSVLTINEESKPDHIAVGSIRIRIAVRRPSTTAHVRNDSEKKVGSQRFHELGVDFVKEESPDFANHMRLRSTL